MNSNKYVNMLAEVLVPLLIFGVTQVGGTIVVAIVAVLQGKLSLDTFQSGDAMTAFNAILGPSLLVADAAAIALVILWKLLRKHPVVAELTRMRLSLATVAVLLVFTVFGMFASDIMSEILALPNLMEEQFVDMSHSWTGILAIAVVGPIAEEYLFRSAILGGLLRCGAGRWTAILVSALIFGIIHLNPAQVPFATIMGVLLGLLYVRSGNLLPSIVCHILNNSVAVYMMIRFADEPDMTWGQMLGGTPVAIGLGIAAAVACVAGFWKVGRSEESE